MARSVTIQEFKEWLKRPEILNLTWYRDFEEEDSDPEFSKVEKIGRSSLAVKYFDICLDTRDMKIWQISTRSFINVSVRDSSSSKYKGKTILDILEEKLKVEK